MTLMKHIEHIEMYVTNLPLAKHFYKSVFQFLPIAHLKTKDRLSVILQHHHIRLILTATTSSTNDVYHYLKIHGDGVKDIAFNVENTRQQFEFAIQNGAKSILAPTVYDIDDEKIIKATVSAFGHVTHTFIQREMPTNKKLPFFQFDTSNASNPFELDAIDHLAICIHSGELPKCIAFYQKVYGLDLTHEEDITTAHSGMKSKVVSSENQKIKLVFLEPTMLKQSSQIAEFLMNGGPGVQHIAFSTKNILSTVQSLQRAGLEMLPIPDAYYDIQKSKYKNCDYDFNSLREHSILIDHQHDGFLYQAFSQHVATKPTLFFEIIQRAGCDGFGSNNIKTLYQAVEQEQLKRESN